jgi:hypothetical protein
MSDAVKILTKACFQSQDGATYEEDDMYLLPLTSGRIQMKPLMIEDEAQDGTGFRNTPRQGNIEVSGSLSFQADTVALPKILEVFLGSSVGGVYSYASNTKKFSWCFDDGVKRYRFANIYPKSLKISSSAGQKVVCEIELIGVTSEARVDNAFPTVTSYGSFFVHNDFSSSGYFRVGDHTDALSSEDNQQIEEFNITMTSGFDTQYANQQLSLTPVYGMVGLEVTGSFKISRYSADTFLDWRDAATPLQLDALLSYGSDSLQIEIPNFIAQVSLTDDEATRQEVEMLIGKNGYGSSYVNDNMEFVSPIRITSV